MLTLNSLPAPFHQAARSPRTSEKFSPISTAEAITPLLDRGWTIRKAWASRVRARPDGEIRTDADFRRHHVLLTPPSGESGHSEVRPEVLLRNANDGSSAYRLDLALFRFVCSNGLVIKSRDFGSVSVAHTRRQAIEVLDATERVRSMTEHTIPRVYEMERTRLNIADQYIFAHKAAVLRGLPHNAFWSVLTTAHRPEDDTETLWGLYNAIQEAGVRGGCRYVSDTNPLDNFAQVNGPVRTVRGVKNELGPIAVKFNRDLWALAEETLAARTVLS